MTDHGLLNIYMISLLSAIYSTVHQPPSYHYGHFYSTATSFEMIALHRKRTLIPLTPIMSQAKRSILSGPVRRAYRTFQNVIFGMSLFPTYS